MNTDPTLLTLEYDHLLDRIVHYQVYPQMRPWVGKGYPLQRRKVLLVAESHYVGKKFEFHLDPVKWYAGVDTSTSEGFRTRDIISDGIRSKWRKKGATLYRNMDSVLRASRLFDICPANAFTEVAFMNYFQRPAELYGSSIKVRKEDMQKANEVFREVVCAISPDAVIFCSSLAHKYASESKIPAFLRDKSILFEHTSHAGMHWWNRAAKKYGGRTGKQIFANFIDQYVARR